MSITLEWGLMPGSWMADTSEEEEHPTVPLGINEMTIPRIALVMSVVTLSALLVFVAFFFFFLPFFFFFFFFAGALALDTAVGTSFLIDEITRPFKPA